MDLRSVLPQHRPLDPTRLRELVSDIKELIERVSALVDVDVSGGVHDLRGIIDRLSVGDIGDFRSEALEAYERARDRPESDGRTLDLIDVEVKNVLIETGKVVEAARDTVRAIAAFMDSYLQSTEFLTAFSLDPQSVLGVLDAYLSTLEELELEVIATIEHTALGIEQWIDAVRRIGSPPIHDQQLAARDARLNEIRQQTNGGMIKVTEQILERGDLFLGDIESDVDLEGWITDHMKVLADKGVRVMMVDIPRSADNQRVLDDFAATRDVDQLTTDLRAILPRIRSDEKIAAAATMYDRAHEHGIRVVAAGTPYRYPLEIMSDRLRLGVPFWAAGYQQVREELAPNERVVVVGDRGFSRSAGGIEGYFSTLYSIDQTHLEHPNDPVLAEGAVEVSPWRSPPLAPDVGIGAGRLLQDDNSDFVFNPPPRQRIP